MTIAPKYTLFALLATLLNLLAQEAVARIYDGAFALYLAMGCGTGMGLVSKYLLDKKYIFQFSTAPTEKT